MESFFEKPAQRDTPEVETTPSQVSTNDKLLNELIAQREQAQKNNMEVKDRMDRQRITDLPDEEDNKVNSVRVAYANYLRYLNQFNVSY
jgi:hypothetical protein